MSNEEPRVLLGVVEAAQMGDYDVATAAVRDAHKRVTERLEALRAQRADINAEVRDLVAHQTALDRMLRASVVKAKGGDDAGE